MTQKRLIAWLIVAVCWSWSVPGSTADAGDERWQPVRRLLGDWRGMGSGFGGSSTVSHSCRFVLQGQFVHMETRSESLAGEDDSAGEVHEDWGLFSFDPDRGAIVLRQFLSEGFVNTYVLQDAPPDSGELVFLSESTEGAGGVRARLSYSFEGDDAYDLVLELASPGKEFAGCQSVSMVRMAPR